MKRREFVLLIRQLTAHDAYVARRALREGLAFGLARLGTLMPGSASLALRIYPASKDAHLVLSERARARGDADGAARHRAAFERLAHNTFETSVLGALRMTLSWRRSRKAKGGTSGEINRLIHAGRLEEAETRADAQQSTVGSRIDALLALASAGSIRGETTRVDAWLNSALALDSGRADVWHALGNRARAEGRTEEARTALERAVRLDPTDAEAWADLAECQAVVEPVRARQAAYEAMRRNPRLDTPLRLLERLATSADAQGSSVEALRLDVEGVPARLGAGAEAEVTVRITRPEASGLDNGDRSSSSTKILAALYVIEPFAQGLLCEPRGRIEVAEEGGLSLRIRAQRPDAVNDGQPWRLELALVTDGRIARSTVEIAVPDEEPGTIHYVITEDHELYDEREAIDAHVAAVTMVDKSRFAEEIANKEGAVWTHMVDIGSLHLLPWAADRSQRDHWKEIARTAREHLVESVERGNDLGLHCHAFHDPGTDVFCHDFDVETDRVTTPPDFLEMSLPNRGFWSRAFPALGDAATAGTRAWATWRGIGTLEALGRLGDPAFRVTLFRAGAFDFGEDAAERARSLSLLSRLGILADSDVPKPRLYHRPMTRSVYPVDTDPRRASEDPARTRALEIRAEFNIEADFLSDVHVLNGYVDDRLEALRVPGGLRPGVHVICSMTHDKFINWRMGRCWEALEHGYGDWATIRDHIAHVSRTHPEVRFSRLREAVLDWYDRYTPALLAWRVEEVVELSPPGADVERYHYPIRLVGRDIPASRERPQAVEVLPPAWLHGRIRDAWIEREGERIEARAAELEPRGLLFEADSRDVEWELVVEAEPGDGIQAERFDGTLRLRSAHGYRRATVEVPASLADDGVVRRFRGVALLSSGDGYEATLSA